MNLWHDVSPGEKDKMNVVVEIPKGSKNKYEVDKKTGLIVLDRAMHAAQDYPFDYGFVPRPLWHDDDPVDVVILSAFPLTPGVLVRVRPVAVMNMIDSGERDDKVIGVPVDDPRFEKIRDLSDINLHTLKEMEHFFITYKKLQNKEVTVSGTKGRIEAEKVFEEGKELYAQKFSKSK